MCRYLQSFLTSTVPIYCPAGLTHIMETSRDYDELLEAWKGWRDVTGPHMKQNFTDYVNLKNEALRMASKSSTGVTLVKRELYVHVV